MNKAGHHNLLCWKHAICGSDLRYQLIESGYVHSCRREHLHPAGGVCTRCLKELLTDKTSDCDVLYAKNYYALEAVNRREPLRLHSEELTAQTDDQAAAVSGISATL